MGDTGETLHTGDGATITPNLILHGGDELAEVHVVFKDAGETIATGDTQIAFLPFGHALGKIHALLLSIVALDAGHIPATLHVTTILPFRDALGEVPAYVTAVVTFDAHHVTTAGTVTVIAGGPFVDTNGAGIGTLAGETLLLHTEETIATTGDGAFASNPVTGLGQGDACQLSGPGHAVTTHGGIHHADEIFFTKGYDLRTHGLEEFLHGITVGEIAFHNVLESHTLLGVDEQGFGLLPDTPDLRAVLVSGTLHPLPHGGGHV